MNFCYRLKKITDWQKVVVVGLSLQKSKFFLKILCNKIKWICCSTTTSCNKGLSRYCQAWILSFGLEEDTQPTEEGKEGRPHERWLPNWWSFDKTLSRKISKNVVSYISNISMRCFARLDEYWWNAVEKKAV